MITVVLLGAIVMITVSWFAAIVVIAVSNHDDCRPCLNLRVDVRVKAAYEREVVNRHGLLRPYAGMELERELGALVGDGRLSDLFDAVHRLSDALGEQSREKKTQSPPHGDAAMCQYRVRETVREGVMDLAQKRDVTYPRDLVERVMWDYAQGRSAVDKAIDRMGRIRDRAESELNAADTTTERRKLEIANALADRPSWTFQEFDDAVDEHASGVSSGSYARQRYLESVLSEIGYTWHPQADGVFVPTTADFVPDEPDVREKPYVLMDRADKREAVRTDALESAGSTSTRKTKYTVKDGIAVLDGRPNRGTVEQILRTLADTDDQFGWDDDSEVALVESSETPSKTPNDDVSSEMDQLTEATPARRD